MATEYSIIRADDPRSVKAAVCCVQSPHSVLETPPAIMAATMEVWMLRRCTLIVTGSIVLFTAATIAAQDEPLRIIAFGAHPDDCDIRAGGTAAKWAALGHKVRFVSVTNGDAGHQEQGGGQLAMRRRAEAQEAGRRIGVEDVVPHNHDGELLPDLKVREQIIRQIREWKADVVLAPRPNDYHPDHRYTGVLLQDAAYMVVVPHLLPDVAALRKNPVFLYYEDGFQRPNPFRPDIAVRLDEVIDKKIDAMDSHVSQFYEWLPWVDGRLNEVPAGAAERKVWLKKHRTQPPTEAVRASLLKWYGSTLGTSAQYYEAFEICEY